MKNTLEVPVKDIVDTAKLAYYSFVAKSQKGWNNEVLEFWEKHKNSRWFWIGKLHWKSINDVEIYLGKPEDDKLYAHWNTPYYKYFHHTNQAFLYKSIIELFEKKEDAIITMTINEYNVLRTYDEKD